MKADTIHIDEENTHIIWGLIALVTIAAATYMLTNAFMAGSWSIAGYTQLISLALFSIGFYGIIRISSPLYHFVLSAEDDQLIIKIWRENDEPLAIREIAFTNIGELRIAPHTPRGPKEALFDFSSSYYLLYRKTPNEEFSRLIDLEDESFTLKVNDIGKIMEFILSFNESIKVPADDALFMNINSSKVNHL